MEVRAGFACRRHPVQSTRCLTINQDDETRKLIQYLELKWEDECLSPQHNKRNVRTVSQQQVRHKVYKGSSQQWRKFEPYLNGVFDQLTKIN